MFNPSSLLLTDFYQLTMLQVYFYSGMTQSAVFELFVRDLPPERRFLLAMGVESVLDYLESARFTEAELEWLKASGQFGDEFLAYLATWRFSGDVFAIPEGTVCFANEPLLRIVAPLPEAQLIESRLINLMHYQTLVASKAARCVLAGQGKRLLDFGFRRAHGAEAGLLAARACYIAGFAGTATTLAGSLFELPVVGTMAHSFVQSYPDELTAFKEFAKYHRGPIVLLIDTFDVEKAAERVVMVAKQLTERCGAEIVGVRIDSGDLLALSTKVRAILDAAGFKHVRIMVSGDLDEFKIAQALASGAPIDGFGIGTRLEASVDAPTLNCVYKLQEYAGESKRKYSKNKMNLPGSKQVFRFYDDKGLLQEDVLGLADEKLGGKPLLQQVMQTGKRIHAAETIEVMRERASQELAHLPDHIKQLAPNEQGYRVKISDALSTFVTAVDKKLGND